MSLQEKTPKIIASRYRSSSDEYLAYLNELYWIQEEACKVEFGVNDSEPVVTLRQVFNHSPLVSELEKAIIEAADEPSPYAR